MNIIEVNSKSILRKQKKIDSWFLSCYGMNLYRGCLHNCSYCDGRTEGYYIDGEFGNDITVKTNAIDILNKELDPSKKRKPFKSGYIILGGGVGDSYQPIEEKYKLSRRALELIYKYRFPVHVLTKSILVKRDIDIIKKIHEQKRAIVSFSFSGFDDKISSIFEPNVPTPCERLKAIDYFKKNDIPVGVFFLPVIPFITDKPDMIENALKKIKEHGVDFIIFGNMTLKEGRQKDYFLNILKKYNSDLYNDYLNIYKPSKWGNASEEYCNSVHYNFNELSKKYKIPVRMPLELFKDILSENDLVIIILEHIDYILRINGQTFPYGYAAYSISKIKEPLSLIKNNLQKINGVGPNTEKIILEILETGNSKYYNDLMN